MNWYVTNNANRLGTLDREAQTRVSRLLSDEGIIPQISISAGTTNQQYLLSLPLNQRQVSDLLDELSHVSEDVFSEKCRQLRDRLNQQRHVLRLNEFDTAFQSDTGQTVYMRQIRPEQNAGYSRWEPGVQFNRALQAMLLVIENEVDFETRTQLYNFFLSLYQDDYLAFLDPNLRTADLAEKLKTVFGRIAEKFVQLEYVTDKKQGQRMLQAMQELAYVTQPPSVIVQYEVNAQTSAHQISVAQSEKVDESYYSDVALNRWQLDVAQYCHGAQRFDGLMNHFFENNAEKLRVYRVPVSPASRYLETPANVQRLDLMTANTRGTALAITHSNTSYRMGTPAPFKIVGEQHFERQQAAANRFVESVFRQAVMDLLKQAFRHYEALGQVPLLVNFQSLLSPIFGEHHGPHADNNERFVIQKRIAVAALKEKLGISDDCDSINVSTLLEKLAFTASEINELGSKEALRNLLAYSSVRFMDANTAVNDIATGLTGNLVVDGVKAIAIQVAQLFRLFQFEGKKSLAIDRLSKQISRGQWNADIASECKKVLDGLTDKAIRDFFIRRQDNNGYALFIAEVNRRVQACNALLAVSDPQGNWHHVPKDFRHITEVALSRLAGGHAEFEFIGCKSARDRTAMVFIAKRCLMQDMTLVDDPKRLLQAMFRVIQSSEFQLVQADLLALFKLSDVRKGGKRSDLPFDDATQIDLNRAYSEYQSQDYNAFMKQMKAFVKVLEGNAAGNAVLETLSDIRDLVVDKIEDRLGEQFGQGHDFYPFVQRVSGLLKAFELDGLSSDTAFSNFLRNAFEGLLEKLDRSITKIEKAKTDRDKQDYFFELQREVFVFLANVVGHTDYAKADTAIDFKPLLLLVAQNGGVFFRTKENLKGNTEDVIAAIRQYLVNPPEDEKESLKSLSERLLKVGQWLAGKPLVAWGEKPNLTVKSGRTPAMTVAAQCLYEQVEAVLKTCSSEQIFAALREVAHPALSRQLMNNHSKLAAIESKLRTYFESSEHTSSEKSALFIALRRDWVSADPQYREVSAIEQLIYHVKDAARNGHLSGTRVANSKQFDALLLGAEQRSVSPTVRRRGLMSKLLGSRRERQGGGLTAQEALAQHRAVQLQRRLDDQPLDDPSTPHSGHRGEHNGKVPGSDTPSQPRKTPPSILGH